jgi:hypothetical protein
VNRPAAATAADPIFITGLYKNGTSWLLSAFAAHPGFVALRELDLLRSVATRDGRRLLPRRERLARVFGKSGFCGLKAEQLARGAFRAHLSGPSGAPAHLHELPPEAAVAVLTAMLAEGDSQAVRPVQGKPLGFLNLPMAVRLQAYRAVHDAASPEEAMDGFLAALAPVLVGRRLVLKGADQILCLDALQRWRPAAPKLAIVRDGRDAAVSAYHYRRLMRERRMAWQHSHLSFWKPAAWAREAGIGAATGLLCMFGFGGDWRLGRSMAVWADRVRRVLRAARRGELMLLRYEDLLTDFAGSFGGLLRLLGAGADPATLARVAQDSSFETQSGRPQGVEGQDVIRKGVAGEWRSALTGMDRALAWRIAGKELTAMGYLRDGEPAVFQPPHRV